MGMTGFADPVLGQQSTFRAVMRALAEPGRIIPVAITPGGPSPLGAVARAIALTLLDFEVRFHLSETCSSARADLLFQTGSQLVEAPCEADFAFIALPADPLLLAAYAAGNPEYPDRSTTIIARVDRLAGGPSFLIEGPGVAGRRSVAIPGLPADFAAQWRTNAARFPLGIDLIFATDEAVLALPRSARIIEETR